MKRLFARQTLLILLLSLMCFIQLAVAQTETPVDAAEAEDGVLTGITISKSVAGYSGSGYITGLDQGTDKVTVTLTVPVKDFYKLVIRYNSTSGDKTQYLIVNNGGSSSVVFLKTTTWSDIEAGKYLLNAGKNTITIQSSWGWMDIDKFSLYTASKNVYNITPDLVNPNANSDAKLLYGFLLSKFNSKIISGQTNSYYPEVKTIAGQSPMIRGWDFQHYTQGYAYLWKNGAHTFGWEDDGSVKQAIDWYKSTAGKGIVTFQWHWHSPSGGTAGTNTFYTDKTTFDVTKAVQSGTIENGLIIRDIDSIASQLKRFQTAGVPILWRPLHEAGGAWFWWGAKGPKACKDLFYIMYDRLTNYHHLNNLIWVWSTPETDWYPGNDFIDIVGHDSYPGAYNYDMQKNSFDRIYSLSQGKKLIAMTENGPIPNPDDCLALDAPWAYFMSWGDLVAAQNSSQHIKDVFNNPKVLTLENPTAVNEIKKNKLSLYQLFPNPAKEKVSVTGAVFDRLEVLNMKGRIVFSTTAPVCSIQTAHLSNGVYVVKFYQNHTAYEQKLIVCN
ncbi:MAG TPA: beta-mannanase [Prolixibacteraceae bacterium]|jgi:mannan endo-1,4-beta-mannosidase|nr:beta-mannanase [Prolixibacteraceae bacterium]